MSALGEKYATLDVKDFYLNSKLKEYEHMKMNISSFPQEFIDTCNLSKLAYNEKFIRRKIRGRMHSLV